MDSQQERLESRRIHLFYRNSDKLDTAGQLIEALLTNVREEATQQGKDPIDVVSDVFLTLEGLKIRSRDKGNVNIGHKREVADKLVKAGIITKEEIEVKGRRNIRKINYRLRLTRGCLLELETKQDELPLYFNIAGGKIEAVYRPSQNRQNLMQSFVSLLRRQIH